MFRVLVVDDSMLIRHTVCRFLEERGLEVDVAENGVMAMQCLAVRLPDLIVTDMQMPGMDGRELIERLRQQPATATIPVIVLTGRRRSQSAESISGPVFVIYKDIGIEQQLERAITQVAPCHAAD
jgi:CheY-like chemotaxis protein